MHGRVAAASGGGCKLAIVAGVILVGGPGSGKTSVGRALATGHGYRYVDREAELVERYGSREAFLAQREAALRDMHARILDEIATSTGLWAHETTALTERDFVLRLWREHEGRMVHLNLPTPVAIERVLARAGGRNLSNALEATRRTWEACDANYDSLPFELVVDAERRTPAEIAAEIHSWRTAMEAHAQV